MARARARSGGSQKRVSEDNEQATTASEPPPKSPSTVSLEQELPDRTPRVTIQAFVRGTKDPILGAFAHNEKLTQDAPRKLTRAEWKAAFEAFKAEPR